MGLTLKLANLRDDSFDSPATPHTKLCSGCDPDVPKHAERPSCKRCRGTGREPMSFAQTFAEISKSRREGAQASAEKTRKMKARRGVADDEDEALDLEF